MKYLRFLLLPLWYLAMSCATQTTPQGGPKDSIPPSVLRYTPKENQTNYKGKEIVVEFDEPIQLNNPKEEIIIIPPVGTKTEYRLRGNALIIQPELPWKDSTTYNINFREGVKDITEGLPAKDRRGNKKEPKDLHLAFSTGPIIDTLSISGKVKNGLDEKIPENITIALYTSDTFNIFDDKPEYFTKSDKEGKFSITNLKAGIYKLYAFEDKNKNLKAETRSEKFGFYAPPIQLDSIVKGLEIAMVHIDTRPPKLTSRRTQSFVNIIRFNKSMIDYDLETDKKIPSSFSNNQTEITAYYPDIEEDSTLVHIKAIDSTLQIADSLIYLKRDKNERIEDAFKATPGDLTYNLETNQLDFSMSFNKPLIAILDDSIYFQYDSTTVLPLKFKSLKIDTIFNTLKISEVIPIDSLPKSMKITIAPSYMISVEHDSSKLINQSVKPIESPTTAVLFVNVQTRAPHFIIQLLNSQDKVVRTSVDEKKITFKFLNPESLKMRAIIDTNGNGIWDTAIYPQNREPERIIYYLNSEKKYEIPLRANWEVGPLNFRF
jgi:uncharacterized protein (DUF2141 family)